MIASVPTRQERGKAGLVLFGCAVGWSLTFAIVKGALGDASPGVFLVLRFALATVVAAVFARRALKDLDALKKGAFLGVLLWAGFALNTWGLKYTTATRSGFVSSLTVVLVPILGATLFHARAHVAHYVGAALAAFGLFVLTAPRLLDGDGSFVGDGLTAASTIVYALHILFLERFSTAALARPSFPAAAVTSQLAVVALLSAATLPFEPMHLRLTPSLIGALLFTGLLASALFLFAQIWAQARTTSVRAAIIFSLEPLFAAFFSWLIVRDTVVPEIFAGGGLIVIAILISEIWPRLEHLRRAPAAPRSTSIPRGEPVEP